MIKPPKNKKMRHMDIASRTVRSRLGEILIVVREARLKTWHGTVVLSFIAGVAAAVTLTVSMDMHSKVDAFKPAKSPLMKDIKEYGCVADGILSGYGGDTAQEVAMISKSGCRYLHRALETWAAPPDFEKAAGIMEVIKKKKPDIVFGMFLAEAINPEAEYFYPDENRNFDFSEMCRSGSENFWGKGTCKANFASKEYQKYLDYITRKAVDMGIQSFLFGQIHFQDDGTGSKSKADEIVSNIRKYAVSKGKHIVIGAQTNDIAEEKYLRVFDYIEGGVGEDLGGNLESGPCLSKWWKKPEGYCWALLWNDKYASRANDVLLHLDWSGFSDDDMSIFARMSPGKRAEFLEKTYDFFKKKGMGFMLPYLAVINEDNGGCYGPRKNFYSASEEYSCRDEKAINAIFEKSGQKNEAEFISQNVPEKMITGKKYTCEVTLKNIGNTDWDDEKNYKLGFQGSQEKWLRNARITFSIDEKVKPGLKKTFSFDVTAPEEPGNYDFQWQMIQESRGWFGDKTENLSVEVVPDMMSGQKQKE